MLPLTTTVPVPFGAKSRVALEVVTMSAPFISRFPPSCGEVSSTSSLIVPAARPDTIALRAIFLSPPPEVSTARNTSSLATVPISDKLPSVLLSTSSILSSAAVAEIAVPLKLIASR